MNAREKVDGLDWPALVDELDEFGCALTPRILTTDECRHISALYDEDKRFRSTVSNRGSMA